jgi:hypothetical protein
MGERGGRLSSYSSSCPAGFYEKSIWGVSPSTIIFFFLASENTALRDVSNKSI